MIEEIKGNLLKTDCELIAHGVNCQGKMESGVAKALYTKWPKVKSHYLELFKDGQNYWPSLLLGETQLVRIKTETGNKIVVNCFTQQNYGYDGQNYLNYSALRNCLDKLKKIADNYDLKEIAIPKIGCGLAGGNWEEVKVLIRNVFPPDFKIKVYYLDK